MNVDQENLPVPIKDKTAPGSITRFFLGVHAIYAFILRFFKEAFLPPYEYKEVLNQFFEVGIKSLSIITLTGFITGLVFTKQSRSSLSEFGATSWLPSLMA
ncbi:ABC transporter permease, partial [Flavitalea flava]